MANDDERDEPWNPDDDKIEKKFLKKLMDKMDKDEEKERKREEESRQRLKTLQAISPRPMPGEGRVMYGTGQYFGDLVLIRPIENGFLVSFNEVLGEPVMSDFVSTRKVEVFVTDAAASLAVLKRAMTAVAAIHKLSQAPPPPPAVCAGPDDPDPVPPPPPPVDA
jgi:hypothetical protein